MSSTAGDSASAAGSERAREGEEETQDADVEMGEDHSIQVQDLLSDEVVGALLGALDEDRDTEPTGTSVGSGGCERDDQGAREGAGGDTPGETPKHSVGAVAARLRQRGLEGNLKKVFREANSKRKAGQVALRG